MGESDMETGVESGIEEPRVGEDYIRAQRGASEPAKGGAWSSRSLPGAGSTMFFLQLLEGQRIQTHLLSGPPWCLPALLASRELPEP